MLGLQNHLGEERKLLGSSLGITPEFIQNERSEKCDESINFESCFQFDEEISNESSRFKDKRNDASKQAVSHNESDKPIANQCLTKMKQLFQFNRKFINFKQLYQQIFFDGVLAIYLLKMRSRCQKYVETSFKDEQLMREVSRELQKDSFHYYDNSSVGNKCLVWGKLNDWEDFVQRKNGIVTKKEQKPYILSAFGGQKEIKLQINNPSLDFNEEATLKTYTKRGILYRLITSLYALNLFKLNVQQGNVQVKFGFVYIFGEKILDSDGQIVLKAQRIFQRINYRNYRRDQTLFSIFGVLVGGMGLYFLSKFMKNMFMCCKKKRVFERVKQLFFKSKGVSGDQKNISNGVSHEKKEVNYKRL